MNILSSFIIFFLFSFYWISYKFLIIFTFFLFFHILFYVDLSFKIVSLCYVILFFYFTIQNFIFIHYILFNINLYLIVQTMQSYFTVKSLTHEISRTQLGPTLPVGGDFTPVPYPTVIPARKQVSSVWIIF